MFVTHNTLTSICSLSQLSKYTDRTLDMCTPRLLCTPEHAIHMKTPIFTDAHCGSLASQSAQVRFSGSSSSFSTSDLIVSAIHSEGIFTECSLPEVGDSGLRGVGGECCAIMRFSMDVLMAATHSLTSSSDSL